MKTLRFFASAAVSCFAACWFLLESATFVLGSAAATDTVTLNSDWFQNHLSAFSAQYYSFDGSYKQIEFQYRSRQAWASDISHIDTPSDFSAGRGFSAYWAPTPQDMYNSATGPFIQFDLNLAFSHVTYIDCGVAAWVGNPANHPQGSDKYAKTPVSEVRPNFYTMYSFGASAIQYLQNNPLADCGGYVNVVSDPAIYGGWFNVFTSSSPKNFNFGEQHICCVATTNGIWIALPDIYINSDYTYDGIVTPDVPSYGQATASGTASGTITTDSNTGVQNVDLNVDVDVPMPDLSRVESGISDIAGALLDGDDPAPPVGLIEPPEDIDYDAVLQDADSILNDIPDITAGSGAVWAVWDELTKHSETVVLTLIVPICILFSLVQFALWHR